MNWPNFHKLLDSRHFAGASHSQIFSVEYPYLSSIMRWRRCCITRWMMTHEVTANTGLYDSGILGNNRGMMKPTTPFEVHHINNIAKTVIIHPFAGWILSLLGICPKLLLYDMARVKMQSSGRNPSLATKIVSSSTSSVPGSIDILSAPSQIYYCQEISEVKSILSLFHMWNNFPEHPQPASHCQVELGTLAPSKFLFINVHRMLVILTCSPTTVLFTVSAQIILYPNLLYPRFIVMGLQLPHPSWQVCRLGGQKEQSWQWIKNHSNPYSHAIIFNMGMFLWV